MTQVMGCGIQKGAGEKYRGVEMDVTVLPKVKVEVIVGNIPVEKVIETAKKTLYTGHVGDGKIFVYNVAEGCKGTYRRRRSGSIERCRIILDKQK